MEFYSDFSYKFYSELVSACNEVGRIVPLREYEAGLLDEVNFIWRHDIDLNAALSMAIMEVELGISSTYMVIPTSPLYSISSKENIEILHQLVEIGHEVALHFDVDSGGVKNIEDVNELEAAIYRDVKAVEFACGVSVDSISFHRPVSSFVSGPKYVCGCLNAYAKELMTFYISDSKGSWREGNPLYSLDGFNSSIGQVLTHPIWWAQKHRTPSQSLRANIVSRTEGMSMSNASSYMATLRRTVPGVSVDHEVFGGE